MIGSIYFGIRTKLNLITYQVQLATSGRRRLEFKWFRNHVFGAPGAARTYAVIERVGMELGAREGTGPEDDPLLGSQRYRSRSEGIRQGRTEGIREGLKHERELLRRMAAVRFGADTAEQLSTLPDGIADPDRLAEAGEWIVGCDGGSELLDRLGSGPRTE